MMSKHFTNVSLRIKKHFDSPGWRGVRHPGRHPTGHHWPTGRDYVATELISRNEHLLLITQL